MAALYMGVFTSMSYKKQQNSHVRPEGCALHGSFHEHELRERAKLPCTSRGLILFTQQSLSAIASANALH